MSKSLSLEHSESGSMTSASEERLIGVCDNGDAITALVNILETENV